MPLKDDKESESVTVVKNEDIHENDVLMGRGGKNNRHVGNEKLRDMARGQVEKYRVSTKKIKSAMSRDLVREVRNLDPPGRFLKRVPETGEWEDVGDYLAREKVAQVLRDAVGEAAEATRPTVNPSAYPVPFMHYPDARIGVFRQGPMPGMQYMSMEDDSRRSALPGVVTSSRSSSFGHPPGYYPVPPPWHHYSPPQPHPPYPGMHPHAFQPGFHPSHPQHFPPAYASAYMPLPGQHPHPSTRTEPPEEMATSPAQQPPTISQATPSFGPGPAAYSVSVSVAAGAPMGTESHTWPPSAYATPAEGMRKRARSLPLENLDEKFSTPSKASLASNSSSASTKRTTATQTPSFAVDFDPTTLRSDENTPRVAQARPNVWDHASRSPMSFPRSSQAPVEGAHNEAEYGGLHGYERPQSAHQIPPEAPTRSHSAPLQQTFSSISGADDAKESEPSTSAIERSRHVGFSSRKVPKRILRPAASAGDFEAASQPGGSGTMEPLPVQPEEQESPDIMPALPNAPRERLGRSTSRRSRRMSNAGGGAEVIHGLDWFQGELLLESDDESEAQGGGGRSR